MCIVRGMTIRFDAETLNEFLGTPITIAKGEQLTMYAQYLHSYQDYEAIMAKLCTPGGWFQLNVEGASWKILQKDFTTLVLDLVASIILRGIGLECRRSNNNQFNNVL